MQKPVFTQVTTKSFLRISNQVSHMQLLENPEEQHNEYDKMIEYINLIYKVTI